MYISYRVYLYKNILGLPCAHYNTFSLFEEKEVAFVLEDRFHYATPTTPDLVQLSLSVTIPDPPASISQVLELQACTTVSPYILYVKII